ncbi:MAG TPA: hypothetical protein VLA43_07105 [Longimicrobiales bacterium]|nr:hypothetical protein [Longimicrobiales bacterium]
MTLRAGRLLGVLVLLVLPVLPRTGAAQGVDQVVAGFVRAWSSEDTGALQTILGASVHLEVDGQDYLGVPPRQAAASVDRLFRRFDPRAPSVVRQGDLGEDDGRGFAELSWSPTPPGSAEPVDYLIFLGLRRSPDGWRITELRILP